MSTNSTNPSTYFGGTWQRIAKGRTLIGVDESDVIFQQSQLTGGEKEHILTVNEIPSHNHKMDAYFGATESSVSKQSLSRLLNAGSSTGTYGPNTTNTGGGEAHNNLPPYFTCYIWEKVGA